MSRNLASAPPPSGPPQGPTQGPPIGPTAGLPSAEAVAEFLRAHPEFLAERPDLFRAINPPRRIHGEVMADHMAAMLGAERRRTRSLEAEIDAAASVGRAGHGLTIRVRLAVLALMRTQDVTETVSQELPALLGIETCSLLSEAPDRRGIYRLPQGMVVRLLGRGREALVRNVPTDTELLHQEAASLVTRDALVRVPLWNNHPTLLVLGARDPATLPNRQANATLSFLGRAVGAALAR